MKDYIFIKGKEFGEYVKILHSDILFIKSNGDYMAIHTISGRRTVQFSLGAFVEQLPSDIFYRCGKSYIVNVDKIKIISKDLIYIDGANDSPIPIGAGLKKELLKKINFISR